MSSNKRTGLRASMDRFIDGLVAGDPGKGGVAELARVTENGVLVHVGQKLWEQVNGREPGGQYFIDDGGELVGFLGTLHMATPVIAGIRLRVIDDRVVEAEIGIAEPGGMFDPATAATPRSVWEEELPEASRRSRDEMIAIANLYFEGLVAVDGDLIPLTPDAFRIENGERTANRPANMPQTLFPALQAIAHMNVAEQINAGHHAYIRVVRDRRFLIADEARGVVFGVFMFDHPGSSGTFEVPPSSAIVFEAFKIVDGRIALIEAMGRILPWQAPCSW